MQSENELHEESAAPFEEEAQVIEIRMLDRIETIGTKACNN
ncbi:hypothetical protein [Kitasatospora camelliae]|uniref:Uncharacterized protein n=1 Tax=Kitasatospora camelliae TaxID=3156397 RepID=A0AAU8KAW2_9ACTN